MPSTRQAPTKRYYEDIHIGQALPQLVKSPITHLQLVRYAGASGDFYPVHTDPQVGQRIGLDGIIAPGLLMMGFVGQLVSDFVGPTALQSFAARFTGMTHLQDVMTCSGTITDKYEVEGQGRIVGHVQATDQTGQVKLTGSFVAVLPKRG
jgi:acyl dehydratase